jgi:hypothetical protein
MKQAIKLFLLALLLISSFACQQTAEQPISTFAEILPKGAQLVNSSRLDIDQDGQSEWVVFYRFDAVKDGGQSSGPIAVAVYRAEGPPPNNLHAYRLIPREDSYLCECYCTARMEDILSENTGPELVVTDNCDGKTTRATIFSWDSNGQNYRAHGHFYGHRVLVQKDVVLVDVRLPDRAQIAVRSTHQARGGTYYSSDYSVPESQEFILYPEECQDVTLSPYPEKIVIAFYHHYCDAQDISVYFTPCAWDQLNGCAGKECGCTRDSSEVARVQVTSCHTIEEHQNEAVVAASIVCLHGQKVIDDVKIDVKWRLVRKDERWKLDKIEIGPRQPWPPEDDP